MKKFLSLFLVCSLAMAETVISPNMNLPVPVVGTTPGPTWANNINSCMSAIDEHDHTPGKGVPISSEAISISSDLSLNGNSLTSTEAVVFSAQSSFATNKSVYVIEPDLYYNDGNGNVVQITQSGSVAGASGTITGLPSGTASASYQSVGGTFQFQSATNTPANITGASISIAQQTTTPNTITFKSPTSLAASYNVTWPTSVPAYASLLSMSTSGVLSTVAYKIPTIQQFTSSSGTYTAPTSPAPIYLRVRLCGGGGGGGAVTTNSGATGSNTTFGNLTGNGGPGGVTGGGAAGGGGSSTVGAGWTGLALRGNGGTSGSLETGSVASSSGGGSALFGGGAAATYNAVGNAGATNSGGGGGGGGGGGAGGGGGGCTDAFTSGAVSATYAYSVGAGGAGGAAGGVAGGDGGAGQIFVEEYYQ